MTMQTASEFLTSPHVQAWCDKQRRFKEMTAVEYANQLTDLIDYACTELPDAECNKVLLIAFNLIRARLGIKIESKLVITNCGESL